MERTSVVCCVAVRREAHSNSDTSIARAKRIKLRRSPNEAQLARVIPIDLAIDNSRIGRINGSELVRANFIRSSEDGACGQASSLNICFGNALEYTICCPVIAEGLKVEGVVEPALSKDSTGVERSAWFESFNWTFDWNGERQVCLEGDKQQGEKID